MTDKTGKTTIYNVTPQQVLRLQQLALDLLGKKSLAALIRYIADNGQVENEKLIVDASIKKGT